MPIVVITSEAYQLLLAAAQARMPADTVGILLGSKVSTAGGDEYIAIVQAVPLAVPPTTSGVAAYSLAWQKVAQTCSDRAQPVGWFLADPAAAIFAARLDKAQLHEAFQPNAALFLDLDLFTKMGVFYVRQGNEFMPQRSVVEVTPNGATRGRILWPDVERRTLQSLDPAIVAVLAPPATLTQAVGNQSTKQRRNRVTTPLVWPESEPLPDAGKVLLPPANGKQLTSGEQAAAAPSEAGQQPPNGANAASPWLADILAAAEHEPGRVDANRSGRKDAVTNGPHDPLAAPPAKAINRSKSRKTTPLSVASLPRTASESERPQQLLAALPEPPSSGTDNPTLHARRAAAAGPMTPNEVPAVPLLLTRNDTFERSDDDPVAEWTYAASKKSVGNIGAVARRQPFGRPALFLLAGLIFVLILLLLMWLTTSGALGS